MVCDNHGDFYFFIREALGTGAECHLVNLDAHPDSVSFSSTAAPAREDGAIQCYNWINALIPRPVSGVTWVPCVAGWTRPAREAGSFRQAARAWLPGGDVGVSPLAYINPAVFRKKAVIVSIDLDFFSRPSALREDCDAVFSFIRRLDNPVLAAVAVSRPYQTGDEETFRILFNVLRRFADDPRFAGIRFEPFLARMPDSSLRARAYSAKGLRVPFFDLEKAPEYFRSFLKSNPGRFEVREGAERWKRFLAE